MDKVLIVDIETTGFNQHRDAIVEIGIVLVNLKTKKIKTIFDKVVKDVLFDLQKHNNAWIFDNSSLTLEDVIAAKPLNSYRNEIQKLFDKYPITAFNKAFDVRFLSARGFTFTETECLMKLSSHYTELKKVNGSKKLPSMEEAYNHFYPNEGYCEKHRGLDDALNEAKLLLKMDADILSTHLITTPNKKTNRQINKSNKPNKVQIAERLSKNDLSLVVKSVTFLKTLNKLPDLIKSYVIDFGKYKGKRLIDMKSKDELQYCEWVMETNFNSLTKQEKLTNIKYQAFKDHMEKQNQETMNNRLDKIRTKYNNQ
jgi:DNA polymerase III epsilon subunit-like protein/uncharacterized protein (DUF3820 family)